MRKRFFQLLEEKMKKDKSLFLLVADMGLGLVERIKNQFPKRFLNVGIAEQNMIGVAAGLCNVGFRPFCYTYGNFLTLRCFEQIRIDICLHKYPITIVGYPSGLENGLLGPTHQPIEDIGILKILPGMRIYSPATIQFTDLVFKDIFSKRLPAYVRMSKKSFESEDKVIKINQFVKKNSLSDILVITYGAILSNCLKAHAIKNNFSIYCMNKLNPILKNELQELFNKYNQIIVIEDHFRNSGLFNSLCQLSVQGKCKARLYSIAIPNKYDSRVGNEDYFARKYGYFPSNIIAFIEQL